MTRLAPALMLAATIAACTKDYRGACEHYFELSNRQLDVVVDNARRLGGEPNAVRDSLFEMQARGREKRESDLDACVVDWKQLRVDTDCVLAANDIGAAYDCVEAARPKPVR